MGEQGLSPVRAQLERGKGKNYVLCEQETEKNSGKEERNQTGISMGELAA